MKLLRRCLVLALAALGLAGSAFASTAAAADGDPFVRACRASVNAGIVPGCTPNVRGRALASALSPDGKNLYVGLSASGAGTYSGLQQYNRNTSTGALSEAAGPEGCLSGAVFAGCTQINGMNYGFDMRFSPDGETLYHLAIDNSTLHVLDRNPDSGNLTPLPCFGATGGCTAITPNNAVNGVAATNDFVYVTVTDGLAVFDRQSNGALSQIACYTEEDDIPNGCTNVVGLAGSSHYRPDIVGNHLYVPFTTPGGVSIFTILDSGLLSQTGGTSGGCISSNGQSGDADGIECVNGSTQLGGTLLSSAQALEGGGGSVYVAGNSGVVAYSRNSSTGLLTPVDCVAESAPPAGCDDGIGVSGALDLETTPDGEDLIVDAWSTNTLSFFHRASNGALTQRSGQAGCMSNDGTGGACQAVPALNSISWIEVADNARDFYPTTFGNGTVGTFERDFGPVCSNRDLGVGHNTPLAVGFQCSDFNGDALTYSVPRLPASGLLGAIDQPGANVVYSPNSGFTGGDSFDYRASARGVDSNVARVGLSVAAAPVIKPPPPPKRKLPVLRSTTVFDSLTFPTFTTFTGITAKRLPANARVTVTCKTKKKSQQRRCPKRKTFRTKKSKKKLKIGKQFANKRLPPGTKITIKITALPKFRGKRITYTVRDDLEPKRRVQCLNDAGTKTASCV